MRKIGPIFLSALLALSACKPDVIGKGNEDPSSGRSDAVKVAEIPTTVEAIARDDLPIQYVRMKEASQGLIHIGIGAGLDKMKELSDEPPEFDVIDCNEDMDSVEIGNVPPSEHLSEQLARNVYFLEKAFRAGGYDRAIYERPLKEYERRVLDKISQPNISDYNTMIQMMDGDDLTTMANEADANRKQIQPEKPKIIADGGCGDGESEFVIKTSPEGGHVWLITKFFFQLCLVQNIDPWDKIRCGRWNEFDPNASAELSGNYVYQAVWPDGRVGRGARILDGRAASGDVPTVVTISPD